MSTGKGFEQTPDGIVPLVGYRLWRVENEDEEPAFFPLNDRTPDWSGATHGWVAASCRVLPDLSVDFSVSPDGELVEDILIPNRVPGEDCTCGFYAMKDLSPQLLLSASMPAAFTSTPPKVRYVLGRVELAGKIIEHDFGYRAERACIVELIPGRGEERAVEAIARQAGVGVGRPAKVPRIPISVRVQHFRFAWTASPTGSIVSAIVGIGMSAGGSWV